MVSNQLLLFSIVFKFVAMFIGVCGNIVVIILTRTSKVWSKEKRETSYLVGNLAMADLLMCLTLYPTWIFELILTILDIESDQLLFCKFSRSFAYSLLFASVSLLLAITVDRYIYILKLLKYPLIVTRRRVVVVFSAVCLTACCIFAFVYVHVDIYHTGLRSICFLSDSMSFPLDMLATYIPISVIVVLNWRILQVTRKQRKKILAQTLTAPDNNISEDQLNKKTRMKLAARFFTGLKAAKTFSIVIAVLIFCIFVPKLVVYVLYYFCSETCERTFHVIFYHDFYGINSVMNAFIYGMRHVKYRKAFRNLLLKVTSLFKFGD